MANFGGLDGRVYTPLMSLLDYAEQEGQKNMEFHIKSHEILSASCEKTLTFILAAATLAMTGAVSGLMQPVTKDLDLRTWGCLLIVIAVALTIQGALLVRNAMLTDNVHPPSNQPKNLYQKAYSLEQIKEFELVNLEDRIQKIRQTNDKKAAVLNKARLNLIYSFYWSAGAAFFKLLFL